jgi:hypothetical protein
MIVIHATHFVIDNEFVNQDSINNKEMNDEVLSSHESVPGVRCLA